MFSIGGKGFRLVWDLGLEVRVLQSTPTLIPYHTILYHIVEYHIILYIYIYIYTPYYTRPYYRMAITWSFGPYIECVGFLCLNRNCCSGVDTISPRTGALRVRNGTRSQTRFRSRFRGN